MTLARARVVFMAVAWRQMLKLVLQRERLAATFVRPLVWLALFAAGFRSVLGLSIAPPYQTYILYEVYIVPGLAGMMLLFHGMQSSLAMVHDRESGSMRLLLTASMPRGFLLASRVLADAIAILPAVLLTLLAARWWGVRPPWAGYVTVLPALLLAGVMLGAAGLLLSSLVPRLENFAGAMNFVIFPAFFASTALYPIWRLEDASETVAWIARLNPFTYAVELIRFALYEQLHLVSLTVCLVSTTAFFLAASAGYDPEIGLRARRRLG